MNFNQQSVVSVAKILLSFVYANVVLEKGKKLFEEGNY